MERAHGRERLTVLHVCADADDARQAQAILDRQAPGTRAYVDAIGLGLARYDVGVLPAVWLIDRSGKAIGRATGALDWEGGCRNVIERYLPPVE